MITEDEPSYHFIALYRRFSARPYRILYVGLNLQLMDYLQDKLEDCWIVRAPAACVARLSIREQNYSLLLFDEVLMDSTGEELERFTRTLPRGEGTPVIIINGAEDFDSLASAITEIIAVPLTL